MLTVAGMSHRKGIAELIEAFNLTAREFPDAHLYLMGEGPERELFEGQAAASPATNQHPLPRLPRHAATLHALPPTSSCWPPAATPARLVLAEAREAGCAIVASDVDGIPEALDGGAAGILVPVQNPDRLAEALLLLLRDPALRRTWAERAHAPAWNASPSAACRPSSSTSTAISPTGKPAAAADLVAILRQRTIASP